MAGNAAGPFPEIHWVQEPVSGTLLTLLAIGCQTVDCRSSCVPRRPRLLITSRFDWGLEAPIAVDLLSEELATELFCKFAQINQAEPLPEVGYEGVKTTGTAANRGP